MDAYPLFEKHVPTAAVAYCYELWKKYPFAFRISRPRQTKLGDFRAEPGKGFTITVNDNLNACAFLITYVHEVAHLVVFQQNRRRIEPHGSAWQKAFRALMQPILHEGIFPASVLNPLTHYLAAPAASTGAHPGLTHALRQLDTPPTGQQLLIELSEGGIFRFLQKEYIRGMKRRTRIVCTEKGTGLKVSIWAHVWVENV